MGVFFSNCVSNISIVVIVVIVVIVATIRFPLSSCRNKNLRDKMPMFNEDQICCRHYLGSMGQKAVCKKIRRGERHQHVQKMGETVL